MDVDECTFSPSICKNSATCKNTVGSYTCRCQAGHTGKNCSEDIDDCNDGDKEKCQNNGTCIDEVGRFSCTCKEPYMGMMFILFALHWFAFSMSNQQQHSVIDE